MHTSRLPCCRPPSCGWIFDGSWWRLGSWKPRNLDIEERLLSPHPSTDVNYGLSRAKKNLLPFVPRCRVRASSPYSIAIRFDFPQRQLLPAWRFASLMPQDLYSSANSDWHASVLFPSLFVARLHSIAGRWSNASISHAKQCQFLYDFLPFHSALASPFIQLGPCAISRFQNFPLLLQSHHINGPLCFGYNDKTLASTWCRHDARLICKCYKHVSKLKDGLIFTKGEGRLLAKGAAAV